MDSYDLLEAAYRAVLDPVSTLDDDTAWRPTRCAGWTVRDLLFHLLSDAQRALVALHTPADAPADVDAISYWRAWQPGTSGADQERRGVRTAASIWSTVEPLAELYAETARAVLHATRARDGDDLVATQGHVLTVADLSSTLAVEATVHQLDLGLGQPAERGLREVRRVLDGLLGHQAPIGDDIRYALVGTGREPLTDDERTALGDDSGRFPLFG